MDLSGIVAAAKAPPPPPGASYVLDVDQASFEPVLAQSVKYPIVVELYSPRANAQALSDALAELAAEAAGAYLLARVNVDTSPQIAAAFGIQAVPAVLGVVGGQLAPMWQGTKSKEEARAMIAQLLQAAAAGGIVGRAQPVSVDADAGPDPRFAAADAALAEGDFETAVAEFDKLLAATPNDPEAKAGRAQAALLSRVAPEGVRYHLRALLAPASGTGLAVVREGLRANQLLEAAHTCFVFVCPVSLLGSPDALSPRCRGRLSGPSARFLRSPAREQWRNTNEEIRSRAGFRRRHVHWRPLSGQPAGPQHPAGSPQRKHRARRRHHPALEGEPVRRVHHQVLRPLGSRAGPDARRHRAAFATRAFPRPSSRRSPSGGRRLAPPRARRRPPPRFPTPAAGMVSRSGTRGSCCSRAGGTLEYSSSGRGRCAGSIQSRPGRIFSSRWHRLPSSSSPA